MRRRRTRQTRGSPPHTRGKVCEILSRSTTAGITPAHAGKSVKLCDEVLSGQDHPRTRGEKYSRPRFPRTTRGSPPHTRGKARQPRRGRQGKGITPAHAGKSENRGRQGMATWDHPRTRGEKYMPPLILPIVRGSPPHTRGKASSDIYRLWEARITPAHAGKSSTTPPGTARQRDHPRTRGEKAGARGQSTAARGSPPHTRGKVDK